MSLQTPSSYITTVASIVNPGDTRIKVASTAGLPSLSRERDYTFLTIVGIDGVDEIIRVDSVEDHALIVSRGREGTAASWYPIGVRIEFRGNADFLQDMVAEDGATSLLIAGENLPAYRAVTVNSSKMAILANNTDPAHTGRIIGITTSSVLAGESAEILSQGRVYNNTWSWNFSDVFVYLSTDGKLTQVEPVSDIFIIGSVVSATEIMIDTQAVSALGGPVIPGGTADQVVSLVSTVTGVSTGVLTTISQIAMPGFARSVKWLVAVSDEVAGLNASTEINATAITATEIEYSEIGSLGRSGVMFELSITENSGIISLKINSSCANDVDVRLTRIIVKN
ncbi:MAG: hypothetical protein H8E42_05110 [Nitrospinae bacterium]|nr:hypothetical protein [Nitrospinota bacterium]